MKINIVFGATGLVGKEFYTLNKKNNFYYSSRSKFKDFIQWDLDKNLSDFPIKKVDRCFFFSSPRIIKKNFRNKSFKKEFYWIRNVVKNILINKMIYVSSSSVFYKKKNQISREKIKCENFLLKNRKKFKFLQIWRPFNLIGENMGETDHIHNILFKEIFEKKKNIVKLNISSKEERGYSDVNDFVKILYAKSKKNTSFVINYGNKDTIDFLRVSNIYTNFYYKIFKKRTKVIFKSNIKKIVSINLLKKNIIFFKKKSFLVLKKYLNRKLNEKKM